MKKANHLGKKQTNLEYAIVKYMSQETEDHVLSVTINIKVVPGGFVPELRNNLM